MAGMNTANSDLLIRSEVWSAQLKDVLQDELLAQKYVNWLTDFPDGNTLTIPSIGVLTANDYIEDTAAQYSALDTGEFQFSITEYPSSATYITNKAKQDGYYMAQLEASFVPKMRRAIMERLEQDIFKEGQPKTGSPAGYQVAGSLNQINGAAHRWVGAGGSSGTPTMGLEDFARARYALKKANVPDQNLIAIVDPSVEYTINTLTNIVNVSNNPRWEGIVESGMGSGMSFVKNIYGFDVYVSDRLPQCGVAQTGTAETIATRASGTGAVANLFFSASSDILPYIGAWRQQPQVDAEYNKDFQREEYVTTARYGVKIYRPENLVSVLTLPSAAVS